MQGRAGRDALAEHPLTEGCCAAADLLGVVDERRLTSGLDPQQRERIRVVACDRKDARDDRIATAGTSRVVHGVGKAQRHPLQHRSVQLLLCREVPVDDEARHPRCGGDVVHRGALEPRPSERRGPSAQQRLCSRRSWEELPSRHCICIHVRIHFAKCPQAGWRARRTPRIGGSAMTTAQLTFTEAELLTSHDIVEPLIAGGYRCHGGFDETGAYVSPRTRNRWPAIEAWQANHTATFGTTLLDVPVETWPEHYPNVAQAHFLLDHGAPEPIISILTRIGTIEGFGAFIRYVPIPDWTRILDDDVRATAVGHLDRGLYEAHARDEAGFENEGGHTQMWYAARDIAFDHPVTADETAVLLERMGIAVPGSGGKVDPEKLRADALANRVLPAEIDFDFESLLTRMISLLFIEISAFHAFTWAETVLEDTARVAGDGEASRIISYIRADETPHVAYLKTVLSEIRDRTVVDDRGHRRPGADIIRPLWERGLEASLGSRRDEQLDTLRAEVAHALQGRSNAADLLAEFDALGTTVRDASGHWVPRPASA